MEVDEIKRTNQRYLNLDREADILKQEKRQIEKAFYNQSFTRNVFDDVIGLVSISFNVEKEVSEHVDTLNVCDKRMERLKLKKRYVHDYLKSLDPISRHELMNKYRGDYRRITITQLDRDLFDEIMEIEEAVNYMLGIKPEPTTKDIHIETHKTEDNFQAIADMLGV
ncbi:hypothetical protein ABID56_002616 [Alkalibacillus flavidus]|uniref:Uncharacterized protein n=1 Tax=Alkalibacillus flavidus TaxID=546021 RepID=A0ABV2KY23_9BACI